MDSPASDFDLSDDDVPPAPVIAPAPVVAPAPVAPVPVPPIAPRARAAGAFYGARRAAQPAGPVAR